MIATTLPPTSLDVRETLLRASPGDDARLAELCDWLQDHPNEHELRGVLRAIARTEQPHRYLEVGCRRGWSLAQVLAEVPDCECLVVDSWIPGYGGVENPGPEWLYRELDLLVPERTEPAIHASGDSHVVLPTLGKYGPFDLITLDGDHTAQGVWCDLHDAWSLLKVGGVLVVDDVQGPGEPGRPIERPDLPQMPNVQTPGMNLLWHLVEFFAGYASKERDYTKIERPVVYRPDGMPWCSVLRKLS